MENKKNIFKYFSNYEKPSLINDINNLDNITLSINSLVRTLNSSEGNLSRKDVSTLYKLNQHKEELSVLKYQTSNYPTAYKEQLKESVKTAV